MKAKDAEFLVTQLNPVLKRSKFYVQRVRLDPDNEDIEIINLMKAVIGRVHYPDYSLLAGLKKLVEEIYG